MRNVGMWSVECGMVGYADEKFINEEFTQHSTLNIQHLTFNTPHATLPQPEVP